jgi:hypothetical protein
MRAAGVVGFSHGAYEFSDGTYALDLAKRFPVAAPSGPVTVADARRRLDRLKQQR